MSIYSISILLAWIPNLLIGTFVFLKNPRDKLNQSFFFLTVILTFWLLGCYGETITTNAIAALNWDKILYTGVCLYPLFYLNFLSKILQIRINEKLFKLIALICFAFLLFNYIPFLRPFFITGVEKKFPFRFIAVPGVLWFVLVTFVVIVTYYGAYVKYRFYRQSQGHKRNQIKYLFFAYVILTMGGSMYFLLPLNIKVPPIDSSLVAIFSIIMAVAILKYHLMDINIVLTRVGIFLIVYAFVLGLPFYLGYRYGLWMYSAWITVLLASAGPFIFMFLQRRAEDLILKEQKRYQKALKELSKTMTRIRDLDSLLKTISLTIVETVKVTCAAIYLKEENYKSFQLKSCYPEEAKASFQELIPVDEALPEFLTQQKRPILSEEIPFSGKVNLAAGLVIPCLMEDELLGFIVLGTKPDNQAYIPDDILIFETLSYSASLAIENCIFWKEIEDRSRKARLQEMDTFSYSLAHEIDNPMQVILGQAGLLKKDFLAGLAPNEKQKDIADSFDFIIESAKRVSGMVKAIRDFGQKTSGDFKPLDIEDVADSFIKLYYPYFKEKTVFFEKKSLLKTPVFVKGEKPELMQVLVILANNAIHAMSGLKDKKVVLTLDTTNHEWAKVVFSDNGYGIKKENIEVIFTPFTTTKASTEGTGMGLYNAKKIIERHKGRIWAESDGSDKGASFIFELPIALDVTAEDLSQESAKTKRLI